MAISYDIDPQDSRTWVNHPAPAIDPADVEELKTLGGLNPHGQPVLRFIWGQERRKFFAGEERILYTDDRLEPVITRTPDSFYVKERETLFVTTCDSYAAMLNFDEKRFERVWVKGKSHAEFIGQPLWFVEEWQPAKDSSATHALNRYGDFEDPASGVTLRHVDLLGDYPSKGRYDAFFVVGEDTGERNQLGQKILRYRPIGRDVIEHVRRLWHARENEKPLSAEQMITQMYEEQKAKEQKQSQELGERIRSDLWPHRHRLVEFGAMAGYVSSLKNVKDFKGTL